MKKSMKTDMTFRHNQTLAVLVTFFLTNIKVATAQYYELLLPVSDHEELELRTKNEYFLQKELYFAKNHRIVIVDIDALVSEAPITIQLFDGESINVRPVEITRGIIEVIRWKGIVEDPPFNADEFRDDNVTEEEANLAFEALFGVEFGASLAEYIEGLDANFWVHQGQPRSSENLFYGISDDIWIRESGKQYFLRLLDMGGPYHVLYEVDESKRFPAGPLYDFRNWSLGKKRREYRDFIESLGEDPKNELHQIREKDRKTQPIQEPNIRPL